MHLPFDREAFAALFASYGQAIWPVQLVAGVLGASAIIALIVRGNRADQIITVILACMWLATGVGYHLLVFATINKAAYLFAVLFMVQAAAFTSLAVARSPPKFGFPGGIAGWLGIAMLAYAMVLYPLVGLAAGQSYWTIPAFGLTSCPVTLFTFGLLLLTTAHVPNWLLVIPGLWSLIGGSAAFFLGMPQDWPLLLGGAIAIATIHLREQA